MLDHFLAMKDPAGKPATMSEVMAEVGNLLAAGADTTFAAIKAVLGYIIRDRPRYKRLQSELDEAVSRVSSRILDYSTLKDLPFLTACFKEGFRLHLSIIYQLPRKAPAEGMTFDGYFIPPSAMISMSPIAQNRRQRIFWS
ncbi:cytochrome P450 [Aspergillus venezuelensis]